MAANDPQNCFTDLHLLKSIKRSRGIKDALKLAETNMKKANDQME